MEDAQLQSIEDEWCREMARQASRAAKQIEARIAIARSKRLTRQSPEMTRALDKQIAKLLRIREELESDIETWAEPHHEQLQPGEK